MSPRQKFPRIYHVPWSAAVAADDRRHKDLSFFEGEEVVVTEQLDGENTTIYPDGACHARSLSSGPHPSRTWVRRFAAEIGHHIPEGWRVCGENMFAEHSIRYEELPSYFLAFSVVDEDDTVLGWEDMEAVLRGLAEASGREVPHTPVLYRGVFDEEAIAALWTGRSAFGPVGEGYVIRLARAFPVSQITGGAMAKHVRRGHVQPDTSHWMSAPVRPNGLREDVDGQT